MTDLDLQQLWQQAPAPAGTFPALLQHVQAAERHRTRPVVAPRPGGGHAGRCLRAVSLLRLAAPPAFWAGPGVLALGLTWMGVQQWATRLPPHGHFEQEARPFRRSIVRSLQRRRQLLVWAPLLYLALLAGSLQLLAFAFVPYPLRAWLMAGLYSSWALLSWWNTQDGLRSFDRLYGPLLHHLTAGWATD